jgi:hypothetical protein
MKTIPYRARDLLSCWLVIVLIGCSGNSPSQPSMSPTANRGEDPMTKDIKLVDEYLEKWDRFAQGENTLVPYLKNNQGEFETALAHMLNANDKRGPARLVFYSVVQVGGFIPADSDLGKAGIQILGPDFPVTPTEKDKKALFSGELFNWWESHSKEYDTFALFDEWMQRDFAKQVVIPMYKRTTKVK